MAVFLRVSKTSVLFSSDVQKGLNITIKAAGNLSQLQIVRHTGVNSSSLLYFFKRFKNSLMYYIVWNRLAECQLLCYSNVRRSKKWLTIFCIISIAKSPKCLFSVFSSELCKKVPSFQHCFYVHPKMMLSFLETQKTKILSTWTEICTLHSIL